MGSINKWRITFLRTVIPGLLVLVIAVSGTGLIRERFESKEQRKEQESLITLASHTDIGHTDADHTVAGHVNKTDINQIDIDRTDVNQTDINRTNIKQTDINQTQTNQTHTNQTPVHPSPVDFNALRAINPDVVGWIQIPGTSIDYPIVQTVDNDTYLNTDFRREKSKHGAIYLDCDSKSDFSGFNNPIYGHNMKDGTMFKDVVKFKDDNFFKEHKYFKLYTPQRTIHLKAVGCCSSDSNGIVRKTKFQSRESFDQWVKDRLSACSPAQVPKEPIKTMFVLVTCSYEQKDARTLLYAVEDANAVNTDPPH